MNIELTPSTLRLFRLTLPRVSRGTALFASERLDRGFVLNLRATSSRSRQADIETRRAFADSAAELVEKIKLPVVRKELEEALKRENLDTPEVQNEVEQALKKSTETSGDELKHELKSRFAASEKTAEIAKNLVNWTRFTRGAYKGALIKAIHNVARNMTEMSDMDQDELEANMASSYAIETMEHPKNLKESPYVGAYLGWVRMFLNRRAGRYPAEVRRHAPGKTTLDQPYESEESEESSPKETVTKEQIGRIEDIDLNDPEVKETIAGLKKQVKQNHANHWKAMHLLLDELVENRTWGKQSDLANAGNFAQKILDANPKFNLAKFKEKVKDLSSQEQKDQYILKARIYLYKTLYPHLVLETTDYFSKHGSWNVLVTMKKALQNMRSSWFQRAALESLADVPSYELTETPSVDIETGEPATRKTWKKVTSSRLNEDLLRVAATQNDLDLAGVVMWAPRDKQAHEHGVVQVFERSRPEAAHELLFSYDEDTVVFHVPDDVDSEHLSEVQEIAERAHGEQEACLC